MADMENPGMEEELSQKDYSDYGKDMQEEIEDAVDQAMDPFSRDNAPKLNLIVNMRIYDALMALLNHFNHDAALALHEKHADGKVIGSLPWLNIEEDDN